MIINQFHLFYQERKTFSTILHCVNAINEIKNFGLLFTKGKNLPEADMFSRPFTHEEMQLNQIKLKHLLPQLHFATLTSGNQIKHVHYLVKHETILLSRIDDCHPVLADFRNDNFSNLIREKRDKIKIEPLDPFSFETVKLFQSQYEKPNKKNTKTLIQQSAILNDDHITDNDDPIEKKIPKNDDPLFPDLSLFDKPCCF